MGGKQTEKRYSSMHFSYSPALNSGGKVVIALAMQYVDGQSGCHCEGSNSHDEDCSRGAVFHDANLSMMFGM